MIGGIGPGQNAEPKTWSCEFQIIIASFKLQYFIERKNREKTLSLFIERTKFIKKT